ncbi:hypothetical protein [Virgibacillus ainsalahensis]
MINFELTGFHTAIKILNTYQGEYMESIDLRRMRMKQMGITNVLV